MNIGLVDVDGHNFPNIAIMKLSTWHKVRGDMVEWGNAFHQYDVVYRSKVFTFTPDDLTLWNAKKIISGGTGYSLTGTLPNEVEHSYPDYEMYGITDTAYGFMTRVAREAVIFAS